ARPAGRHPVQVDDSRSVAAPPAEDPYPQGSAHAPWVERDPTDGGGHILCPFYRVTDQSAVQRAPRRDVLEHGSAVSVEGIEVPADIAGKHEAALRGDEAGQHLGVRPVLPAHTAGLGVDRGDPSPGLDGEVWECGLQL